ncbi:MAG: hypothetical protein GX825_05140, partial [Syntrophomonadaceae bacterium]|nr:hypothetical protein [Syntrophomonadaceae bacterium]
MIVKILKILGFFVVAMGLGFAVMYFDFVKPPEIVRKIPVVGSLLVENKQKDNLTDKEKQSVVQQQKYDRLIKEMNAEIDIAKNINSKLENENVELLAEIATLEKEIDILKTAQMATESEAARLKKLAGYYGNMKAKQAAAIMSELDDTT